MTTPTIDTMNQLRFSSCKALDLWTYSNIFSLDPRNGKHPPFQNLTMLLHFVQDGNSGLLGYCQRLHTASSNEYHARMQLLHA